MKFHPTLIPGAYVIELEPHRDERGFFGRSFCAKEFEAHGLCTRFVQSNLSYNAKKGILRGLHYQAPPSEEIKLVQCLRGSIYDVILDLRFDSPTYKKWIATELTSRNLKMHYIPVGCAHGYQTLEDETEVFYQMSFFHQPEAARGVRWNDPKFRIEWPAPQEKIISEKDRNFPDYPK